MTRHRTMCINGALLVSLLLVAGASQAQSPFTGQWRTTDPVSLGTLTMALSIKDGQMNGQIVTMTDKTGQPIFPSCQHCMGDWDGKPLIGSTFIEGLRQVEGKWVDGHIVDLRPDSMARGLRVNCEIELVGDLLRVYGYKVFHSWGRPSFWNRVPSAPDSLSPPAEPAAQP